MHHDNCGFHLQHFPRVLDDEADAGETHGEEYRRQDARHYRPRQRERRQPLNSTKRELSNAFLKSLSCFHAYRTEVVKNCVSKEHCMLM